MVAASVDQSLAIRLRLEFIASDGSRQLVPFTFNTGFSEHLSLPLRTLTTLGCTASGTDDLTQGDGQKIELVLYSGRILWDGQEIEVPIHELEGDALLGMKQVENYVITIPARFNETVTFVPLPQQASETG